MIVEQAQTETGQGVAVTNSQGFYRLLFDRNPEPMWVYDTETYAFLAVNEAAVRHYGYTEEEFLSMTILDILPVEDVDRLLSAVEAARTTRAFNQSDNAKHRKKDRTFIEVEIAGSPIEWNGRPAGFMAAHDVSAGREAERDLLITRANLRAIVESTDQLIWSIDRNRGLVDFNRSFARVFEAATGAAPRTGVPIDELLPGQDRTYWLTQYRKVLGGERFSMEFPYVIGEDLRFFNVTFHPIVVNGDVTGGTMFAVDSTESKREAARKERLFHDLRERVKELRLLHDAANLMQEDHGDTEALLRGLVERIPVALQYPESAAARVGFKGKEFASSGFQDTPWKLRREFETSDGSRGYLEVVYLDHRPDSDIGPFLRDEQELLGSLAEMIHSHVERKALQRAVSESREWFKAVFDSSRDGILVEHEGAVVYANASSAAQYGYDAPEDLIGLPVSTLQSEQDNERMLEFSRRRRAGLPASSLYEFKGRRKDGALIDLETSVSVVTVGGKQYIVAMERDISDRKAAERALEESEERYRRFFQDDLSGNFIATPAGRLIACNVAFARIFGFPSVEKALAGDLATLEKNPAERMDLLSRLREQRCLEGVERTMVRKDGNEVEIVANVYGEFDEKGRLLLIKGYVLDVTEQKRAFRRLGEQAALLDITRDAIIVRRFDDTITLWNKAAERMYGWTREEVVGTSISGLLRTEERETFERGKQAVLQDGEWNEEYQQATKSGATLIVEAHWTLIRRDDGTPDSILVVEMDVTERRAFQKQLSRTQRLESLGTLAGGIAHDLNNVLGPILMGSEVLLKKTEDPSSVRLLESMERSARRGAEMVKQVLTFARGLEGERVNVQLKHIVREIITFVTETFPKSIIIRKNLQREVPSVLGDATQVHQVILNLAVNARDAMPSGGTLTFGLEEVEFADHDARLHAEARAGRYVVLSVGDTGSGIAPDVLDRIFDPFFSTKPQDKGTGLGLSTVLGIVRSHGGFIGVTSEPGKGSEFRVFLPAVEGAVEQHREITADDPRGNGETILLVEDEPSILDASRMILETNGYQVLSAAEGTEALALYTNHRSGIRLVVTDMAMPVMNGPATIRALQYLNPGLPVVVCSGMFSGAESLGPTVRALLQKPYTASRLLAVVRRVLEDQIVSPS